MELRERFLKIYANLPLGARKEIIVVLEKEPMTWSAAYVEVYSKTAKGEKILEKLKEMNFI